MMTRNKSGTVHKFRAEVIPFAPSHIDRANLRLYGTTAMQEGEAIGHKFIADTKTLEMMSNLANQRSTGIVHMRFGHPGISENAMGKKVAKAYNFRVEGDKLKHDVQFFNWAQLAPTFPQNPVQYILERAEKDPDSFGESVVISLDVVWKLDDGTEIDYEYKDDEGNWTRERPENSVADLPFMRPYAFHFDDFVGDGALTPNGLFSSDDPLWQDWLGDLSSEYAEETFRILDTMHEKFGLSAETLLHKATTTVHKWTQLRGLPMNEDKKGQETHEPIEVDAIEAEIARLRVGLSGSDADAPHTDTVDEPDDAQDEELTALNAQVEALQTDVINISEDIVHLSEQVTRMSKQVAEFMKLMTEQLSSVQNQVRAINEEDIVTQSVGGNAFAELGSSSAPKPKKKPSNPQHFSQRVQRVPHQTAQDIREETGEALSLTQLAESDPEKAAWDSIEF